MFFDTTSSVADSLPPLAIVFPSVTSSAPGAEKVSCNDGVCWYYISGSKKRANLVGGKKRTLSEMDNAYFMIQGISLGMESVNFIYWLNALS